MGGGGPPLRPLDLPVSLWICSSLLLGRISSSYIGVGSRYVGEWNLLMLSGISSSDVGVGSLVLMLEIGISSSYVGEGSLVLMLEWDL